MNDPSERSLVIWKVLRNLRVRNDEELLMTEAPVILFVPDFRY